MNTGEIPSESFCVAPWIHAHMRGEGERFLCCVASHDSQQDNILRVASLSDWWNSSYMKSVRAKMLRGETLPECKGCTSSESELSNRQISMKSWLNKSYAHHIENITKTTTPEGNTTHKPTFFDYRMTTCNFKCRTCGDHSSSTIRSETLAHSELRVLYPHTADSSLKKIVDANIKKIQEEFFPELERFIDDHPVESLYWAGGEPLLNRFHWKIMESLVANGRSREICIQYNTNTSYKESVRDRWYKLLPHFKEVRINCSLDGTGSLGEYIRSGLDYEIFKKNLIDLSIFGMQHNLEIRLDVTITSLGLIDLKNIIDLAIELNTPITCKLMLYDQFNSYLSPYFWPISLRQKYTQDALNYISQKSSLSPAVDSVLQELQAMLSSLSSSTQCLSESHPDWKVYQLLAITKLDGVRRESLLDICSGYPDISNWLQNWMKTFESNADPSLAVFEV